MGWNTEEYDTVVEDVEEILDTNCDVYIKRMEYYLAQQDYEQAYAECEQYLSLDGNHGIYMLMRLCIKDVYDGKKSIYCRIDRTRLNVHVIQGESLKFYINRADASVNELKDMLMGTVKYIGDVLGLSSIYDELVDIYAENRSLIKTAKTVDKAIKESIAIMQSIDPDDKLGKIAALKQVVYDGDYEEEYRQSILDVILDAILWIVDKISVELKVWCGCDAKDDIVAEVENNIASYFKKSKWKSQSLSELTNLYKIANYTESLAEHIKYQMDSGDSVIENALSKRSDWGTLATRKVDGNDILS